MWSGLRKGCCRARKGTGIPGSLSACGLLHPHALKPGLFCFSVQGGSNKMPHFSSQGDRLQMQADPLGPNAKPGGKTLIGPAWARCHPGPIKCAPQQLGGGEVGLLLYSGWEG